MPWGPVITREVTHGLVGLVVEQVFGRAVGEVGPVALGASKVTGRMDASRAKDRAERA